MTTGIITTVSGTGEKRMPEDGVAFATAPLNGPRALDFDADGDLWLALREGNAVYQFDMRAGTLHHRAGNLPEPEHAPKSVALLIGPEGGLSESEILLAQQQAFQPLRLGERVLRTETAPLVALSILQARWGDMAL